jgi:hypothetical protein
MVARINSSKSIVRALNYNEQKVRKGRAECLAAQGFLKEVNQLGFYDKLHHFERLLELNERVVTNTLHISLNFDVSEKLEREKLVQIAQTYMEKIGFGDQPYLVYQHFDSGHPHLHLVSTNIQRDGSRISLHNLGLNQSEKARKEIELAFGLVKAESKKKLTPTEAIQAQRVVYGSRDTKGAISNVLGVVLNQYKYTSLAEFNAILGLYNVTCERGKEGSKMYAGGGLVYRVLDPAGNKIGAPIKASAFYSKPTLKNLELKFRQNEEARLPHKKRLTSKIEWTLLKGKLSLESFLKDLEKQGIHAVLRRSKGGGIYGITYVDHQTQCVFNGSDLGKEYSAKAILEKCGYQQQNTMLSPSEEVKISHRIMPSKETPDSPGFSLQKSEVLKAVIEPLPTQDFVPYQLKKTRKKKKRQSPHL